MSQKKMAGRDVELPEECWELIFDRLGHHYRFEVISLVSKHLLTVSSHLKRSLTINDPTIHVHCNLSHFFQRFNKLSHIELKCFEISEQELNEIVLDIARSGLDLEELHVWNWTSIDVDVLRELGSNMKNLRSFRCMYSILKDSDLVAIANSIPQLQEFDIKLSFFTNMELRDGFVTDEGIRVFASKVTQLRRIHMYANRFATDEWLIALFLNCKFLTEIEASSSFNTCQLTENGVGFALRHCESLMSLYICGIKANNSAVSSVPSTLFSLENSISHARALCELEISNMVVSDALLFSIAKARLPLKKLGLWF